MISIKKGASFRAAFKADTQEEWDSMFPADYVVGQVRFGDVYFDLEVTVDNLALAIYIKGDTEDWPYGEGEFDLRIIYGDYIQTIPELNNIPVEVLDGVTK